MTEYTSKQFWDSYYGKFKPHKVEKVVFADIFEKYLKSDSGKDILEIGCAGGDFLVYLAKRYHYKAFGVDYSDELWTTEELSKFNDLPAPTLFKEDIFKWNPGRQFDIVCSFGFLEHFDDPSPVIKKHLELLKPGGTLIITMPHFAHLQYFFHWLIDRENLKKHNTKIMNLESLRNALLNCHPEPACPVVNAERSTTGVEASLSIQHLNYYRTFGFWVERPLASHPELVEGSLPLNLLERIIYHLIQFSGRVINKLLGLNHPNPLVSPHLILIAQKQRG